MCLFAFGKLFCDFYNMTDSVVWNFNFSLNKVKWGCSMRYCKLCGQNVTGCMCKHAAARGVWEHALRKIRHSEITLETISAAPKHNLASASRHHSLHTASSTKYLCLQHTQLKGKSKSVKTDRLCNFAVMTLSILG